MTKLNSHTCDCIVIGGGAAGMMSAVCASQGGASVILIEHTARLGSKILQTGNGKCNFTNLHMQADCYQNGNSDFVMQVLNTFPVQDTLEFFENAGIYHKDRNGYVYPHSETAASLQSAPDGIVRCSRSVYRSIVVNFFSARMARCLAIRRWLSSSNGYIVAI